MLIASAFLLPALAVSVIALAGAAGPSAAHRVRRTTAILAPLTTLPAVLLSLFGEGARLEVPWLLLGAEFYVDPWARSLTLIAALLYSAALMAVSWTKLRDTEKGSGALTAFLLVCFVGNVGTYVAADAASFYAAFALLSFSAAGLVIHYRSQEAQRATRIYLVMSVISETAILAGLILTASAGGHRVADAPAAVAESELTGLIVVLLLIGFGVKAGTVPLHVWLPLAHPAAPPAASAVLSGAMVKAGLVGWLRFLPLGEAALAATGYTLLALALVGAFAAAAIGVLQRDPKVVLAYSTISQMGFITCLVAAGLLVPELASTAAAASVLYAVHHGLAKGALFLGVPVAKHFGTGGTRWLVLVGLVGAALAVAGAPLTSGAYGKYVSKETVEGVTFLGADLYYLLPLVATGSVVLLMRCGWLLWSAERHPEHRPAGELASWLLVCAAGVAVPWLVGAFWLEAGGFSWELGPLWDATWPLLLGVVLGLGVWWSAHRGWLPGWAMHADGSAVQPGDLVVAEESLAARAGRGAAVVLDGAHRGTAMVRASVWNVMSSAGERTEQGLDGGERRLRSWEFSGAAVLVVLVAALMVLSVGWLV
ncbi:proton-conducting transporter membrane subunit [Nesterenkonia populi]|uniref:proton-conducting transporter transmembrane domain-containing protein n=1 Tax=Nesterenkonia populi TaxID=1591087 RepID=UPI001B8842CB|nr:proton-conducting transporter membrane subunit [Nesterenkonia populi]